MSEYKYIYVETYGTRESSTGAYPARPLTGQGFSTDLKVECSKIIRAQYPVGTRFKLKVKLCEAYGVPFLYSHYRWTMEAIPDVVIDRIFKFEPTISKSVP
jgi:hypothetical protein